MVNLDDTLLFVEFLGAELTDLLPIYGTMTAATAYWSEQINGQEWFLANQDLRTKSMIAATKMIDDLEFVGRKADPAQVLKFPRNAGNLIPIPIQEATYEIALELLKGVLTQSEYENTFSESMVFGRVRMDYAYGNKAPEYLVAGIPSQRAWIKLKPYLADNRSLSLRRDK